MQESGPRTDPFARLKHDRPRLLATAGVTSRMRCLVREDRTAAKWFEELAGQAEKIVALPPLSPDWVHDPAETGGAALTFKAQTNSDGPASPLDIARLFVLRVLTLGIVWFATENDKYRERLKTEVLAVCNFPDWLGDQFLVTAETSFGAAVGYDWLFNGLTEVERGQIADAILKKGIAPGCAQFAATPPAHWTFERMNWNLVCNSALMIAALSVAEADRKTAQSVFSLCRSSIDQGFSLYKPDGGWIEGPGYWHYATQYAVYLVDCLATALETDLGLELSPGFGRTGIYRLHAAGPSGKLFNYGDSDERHSGGYWLFWLAQRFHHPVDAWIERHRGEVHPMDLLWFDPSPRDPSSDHLPTGRRFRGAEVAMLRGSWTDTSATYVGIKAGANNSCPHAHYDLGSFVIDADQVRWAIDLGPDDYNLPGYFEASRSLYYRTSTVGHNTLVIGGKSQPAAASAPIIRSTFSPTLATVTVDLSEAYPACARVLRGVALVDGRHVVVVDEITPNQPVAGLVWQMHSRAEIEVKRDLAIMSQSTGVSDTPRVAFFLQIREPVGRSFAVSDATPGEPFGQNPNAGVRKLILAFDEIKQPLRLMVVSSPDRDACSQLRLPSQLRRSVSRWGRGVRQ
jgi:hypothetical protein